MESLISISLLLLLSAILVMAIIVIMHPIRDRKKRAKDIEPYAKSMENEANYNKR